MLIRHSASIARAIGAGLAVTIYSAAALILLRYMTGGRSGLGSASARLQWSHFADIPGVDTISAIGAVSIEPDRRAGYGTAARLDYMMMPLWFGLASATLMMVGICAGAGDIRRAMRITWIGCAISAVAAEVIGITVALFPSLRLRLFTVDPAVLAAGSTYLRIVGPTYFAMTAAFILGFAVQGGGRPLWPVLGGTLCLHRTGTLLKGVEATR
jgi:Na+-driven multidrug efflux pump